MNTLSLTPGPAKLVRSKDWVNFHCLKCGQCCRDLENVVMVESLDAYRIARYLRLPAVSLLGGAREPWKGF